MNRLVEAGAHRGEIESELRADAFHADPYPTYARLRKEAPVHFSESWNGSLVSGYASVKRVLGQPALFSSAERVRVRMESLPAETWEQMDAIYGGFRGFFWSDPPEYTAHRDRVGRAFRPQIGGLADRIGAIVDEAIDDVADAGTMDVIRDLAFPLPATVIFEVLGIPLADRDLFRGWAEDMIQLARIIDTPTARQAMESMDRAVGWVRTLLAARGCDMPGDLIRALTGGPPVDELSDRDARAAAVTLIQFLLAGHETTTNLIGNGLFTLLSHPDQLAALRADPSLVPRAVEEMLRFESPLQYLTRRATEDVEIEGTAIPRNGLVLGLIGAANRDPAQFPDPDVFDVARHPTATSPSASTSTSASVLRLRASKPGSPSNGC